MKKVLITGSEGFIGGNLKEYFKGKYEIITYDLRIGWEMDVRNRSFSADFIKKHQPQVIIHLAANVDISKSVFAPAEDLEMNTGGTVNILEAARESKPELIIFTSTAQVYGEPQSEKMAENHPINPKSPYAISKYSAEQYCNFYCKKYSLPVVIFRFFNIYGPGQAPGVVVPSLIDKIYKADKEVDMYGSIDDSRDFIYVKDLCRAFDLAIKKKPIGQVINFGSGKEVLIISLAKTIAKLFGKKVEFKYKKENIETAKITKMIADTRKAKKILNWAVATSLEDGLKETISKKGLPFKK